MHARWVCAPLARIVGQATSGLAPRLVLMTPVEAVRRLLTKIGWSLADVDLVELNEAFSVQAVAVMHELGLDEKKLNVNGGAVALGHAIGSSGGRVLTTLLYALKHRRLKRGIATLCLGGGNGVALAVEMLLIRPPLALTNAMMNIRTIGVVGAGTMGNGIAQVFAQAGYDVRLVDVAQPMLDRARTSIDRSLAKFVEKGKLSAADRDATLARLTTYSGLDALADVDYIVEAIVENADAKRELFARLDALAGPDVILSSNTSSISITLLGAATKRPDKVLGMHFMNPVPLMTLVELIRGQATSDDSMRRRGRTLHQARKNRAWKPPTIPASSRTAY